MKRGAQWAIASRTLSSRSSCCTTRQYLLYVVAEVLEEDDGAVASGRTRDRAAGVRGRTGLIEAGDRHAVLGPARRGPARAVVRPAAVATVDRPVPHVLVVLLDVDGALHVFGENHVVRHVRRCTVQRLEILRRDL